MRIFYSKTFKNYFLMMCCLFICEFLFKLINGISILDWSLLRIFIGINMVSLLFGFLYSFTGRIIGNILTGISCFFFTIYGIIQTGFYHYLGTFMSYGNISQYDAVIDGVGDFLGTFKWYFYIMLLPFILVCLYYAFVEHKIHVMQMNEQIDFSDKFDSSERKDINARKGKREFKNSDAAEKMGSLIIILVLTGFYYSTYTAPFMQNDLQIKTNKELLLNPDFPNIASSQMGYVVYSLSDLKATFAPVHQSINSVYSDGYAIQEQKNSDFTRNIDDTIWKKLISDESNSDLNTLNNYYISQSITDMNDYTGMFYNKNLIIISMESVNNIALNASYYPNIYKLYSEGWSWDNSFSPRSSCSSGNSELSTINSLYVVNNNCAINNYMANQYPESLFNLFNNSGYTTSSYHNYTEQYYNRSISHTNMGSGHYYGVQELGIPYNDNYEEWPSDVELVNKFLKTTAKEEKFMAFISTVSTSQPYGTNSELGNINLDTFNNTNYSIQMKRYMSKLKVLDDAIGALLDGLEAQGKLDNTVIVLYGNHYPFGLNTSDLNKYFNSDVTKNGNIDRTPFVIYNSKLSSTKYKEYTSYVNIAPTIANLFALDYDPRLYAGHDILSKDYESRVIFNDGSWRDEVAYFDATSSKVTYFSDNKKYTQDELNRINNSVKEKVLMSNLSIKSNYFNYYYTRSGDYIVSPISGEAELKDEETESK